MLDVFKVLRKMAENSAKLADKHKADVEKEMKDIHLLLTEVQELIAGFGKKGWLQRAWGMRKHAKTLSKLDRRLRTSMEMLMRMYQLASDADSREQFLEERKYALEVAIEEQVQKRMREQGESEEDAVVAAQKDPQAISVVAAKAPRIYLCLLAP